MFVLCKEDNLIMNQYNLPDCNALNFENTQSLVKLYWMLVGKWNSPKCLSIKYCYMYLPTWHFVTYGFHKLQGISQPAQELLSSYKGLFCTKLVSWEAH